MLIAAICSRAGERYAASCDSVRPASPLVERTLPKAGSGHV